MIRALTVFAVALWSGCSDTRERRPDGGWCYWATDIIKTDAQCECVLSCYGCCGQDGLCVPLRDGQATCPTGQISGIVRL